MCLDGYWGAALAVSMAGCLVSNPDYRSPPDSTTMDLSSCYQYPPTGGGTGQGRPEVFVPGGTGNVNGVSYPVNPFYLDVYLVTVSAYRDCYATGSGPCTKPSSPDPYCNWSTSPGSREDNPINCITQPQAAQFCQWAGRRLPTEGELAYAGWGKQEAISIYPWGSSTPQVGAAAQLCWSRYSSDDMQTPLGTCPVGAYPYPAGAHSYTLLGAATCPGAADLAGNVWEWTSTQKKFGIYDYPESKCITGCAVLGGHWGSGRLINFGVVDPSSPYSPDSAADKIGVRCARTP